MNSLLIICTRHTALINLKNQSSWDDYYENNEYKSISSKINITESGSYYWGYSDAANLSYQAIFMQTDTSLNVSLLVEFSNFKNIFVDVENLPSGGAIQFENGNRYKCTHTLSNNCVNARSTIALYDGGQFCNSLVELQTGINEVNYSSVVNCGRNNEFGVAPIRLMYGNIKIENDNVSSCRTVDTCCIYVWNASTINLCLFSNCSSSNDFNYSTAIVLRYGIKINITNCNIILNNAKMIIRNFAFNLYFSECNIFANTGSYLFSTGVDNVKINLIQCFLSNPIQMTTGVNIVLNNLSPQEFFAPVLQFEVKKQKCTYDYIPYIFRFKGR